MYGNKAIEEIHNKLKILGIDLENWDEYLKLLVQNEEHENIPMEIYDESESNILARNNIRWMSDFENTTIKELDNMGINLHSIINIMDVMSVQEYGEVESDYFENKSLEELKEELENTTIEEHIKSGMYKRILLEIQERKRIEEEKRGKQKFSDELQEKERNELEELKAKRDELAAELEKMEQQVQSAKQLLESYDALLNGEKQNSDIQVKSE